ncbi:MAG: hypothetical protein ACOX7F_02020 [Eubacteriales bacterium]
MTRKRLTALLLTVALMCGMTQWSWAQPPQPQCDESLYTTLGWYGGVEQASVVKSYRLNGAQQITDYGQYEQVQNMSTLAEPQQEDGQVQFAMEEGAQQFYFEGRLEPEQVVLPWTFDLVYRLNGVEVLPEDLPGAQGMVEITLHAIPNEQATAYQKNNMMLEAAALVDTEEIQSVEAPGAQVQTVGGRKAVVFMALPGEEQTFTLRMGTNDFSFAGFWMVMAPVTLSQMEDVKELREAKEKTEESGEAISDSLDVVLDTMDRLQNGLSSTSQGLQGLDDARQTISSGKGQVYAQGDEALASLDALAAAMTPMEGHLQNAQTVLDDVQQQMSSMVEEVKGFQPQLKQLREILTQTREDLDGVHKMLRDWKDNKNWRQDVLDDLEEDLAQLEDLMEEVESRGKGLKQVSQQLQQALPTLPSLVPPGGEADPILDPIISNINTNITIINKTMESLKPLMTAMAGQGVNFSDTLADLGEQGAPLADDLQRAVRLLDSYAEIAEKHASDAMSLIDDLDDTCALLEESSRKVDTLIDQLDQLDQIIQENQPKLDAALQDAAALSASAAGGVQETRNFLKSFRDLAQQAGNKLDSGTKATLNGLISSLNEAVRGLAQTGTIQNAKDTVEDLVEDEWDKFSGDANNLLNIDPDAQPESFTSSQNPAPTSVQIVVRTREITQDSVEPEDTVDPEAQQDNGTVWTRVCDIFRKIWQCLCSIVEGE